MTDAAILSDRRAAPVIPLTEPDRLISTFEYWPGWLFYTPVVLHWLWLGLIHRGFTLPTAANPCIEAGGLCGESKTGILDRAGPEASGWIAPFRAFQTGTDDVATVRALMRDAALDFPVVIKPDIGCHGAGVRLVRDDASLAATLAAFPRGVVLLVQHYVAEPGEAGVFYVRHPDGDARLTSITLKNAPVVRGDGSRTLRALIHADARLGRTARLYLPRLGARADAVVPDGEDVPLVFAGNHCKGSLFRDGTALVTEALRLRIDAICRDLPDFHFGRIDLRFRDLASLRRGEGFRIIEINGIGSEATHIWDPRTRLRDAYRAQFHHYREAFAIGHTMRARGHRPTRPLALLALWRRQTRLIASYPMND